ncbi:LysR family transcriptional regulator [Solimicrobium silvestre]|uniref:LysR substrate binding domain n=1 Tax=Solimicrobium silvestre TaxID=2099400 RepID=A0A2S9GY51_9BURK|nr:LysR family transcriptional regulator [Solimicrobium silvestre]PRC92638.1 LysR substrate binding domain [Solimicrobium silvestre]
MYDLEIILAIAKSDSFKTAMLKLCLSKSTFSDRLKKIENSLGVKIVTRSGPFGLTKAGEIALKHANQMLASDENMRKELASLTDSPALRIVSSPALLIADAVPAIGSLLKENENMRVATEPMRHTEVFGEVLSGAADIGLIPTKPLVAGLVLIEYKTEPLVVVANHKHPINRRGLKQISFIEALEYDFVTDITQGEINGLMHEAALANGKSVNIRASTGTAEMQSELVKHSIGIAVMPMSTARRYFQARYIRLTDAWTNLSFSICLRESDFENENHQNFIKIIKKKYGEAKSYPQADLLQKHT